MGTCSEGHVTNLLNLFFFTQYSLCIRYISIVEEYYCNSLHTNSVFVLENVESNRFHASLEAFLDAMLVFFGSRTKFGYLIWGVWTTSCPFLVLGRDHLTFTASLVLLLRPVV